MLFNATRPMKFDTLSALFNFFNITKWTLIFCNVLFRLFRNFVQFVGLTFIYCLFLTLADKDST